MKIRSASWCVGVLLLIGALSTAETAEPQPKPLTQVGPWMSIGSQGYDLVINEDLAYVATYHGLKIVDLSPLKRPVPGQPVLRGSLNLGLRSYGIAFNECGKVGPDGCEAHVYVTNLGRDLQIINVSNPAAPVLVSTKLFSGGPWDIALKDDWARPGAPSSRPAGSLIAYLANFGGELYVMDVSNPASPQQKRVIGLNGWGSASADAANLNRLRNYATGGGGKVTGVSLSGNHLGIVEWAQGRFFYYTLDERPDDDKRADDPRFEGTSYAPFLFRVKIDPAGKIAYSLSAFGGTSGIYSVPLDILGPGFSLRHPCPDASTPPLSRCGYFHTTGTDFGGLNISANGKYVFHISGKRPTLVQVINVEDPTNMWDAGSVSIPPPYARLAQPMGLAQYGREYIIAAGATLGLGVFRFQPPPEQPGLSD